MSEKSKFQMVGYVRVSSIGQNTDRQLDNIQLDKVFVDKISGSTKNRPELQRMLEYVRQGDTVIVHSLDRLARNLEDLLSIIKILNEKQVTFKSLHENLTLSGQGNSPMDKLILQVFGAIAEFNRSLIREAQREGIEKAKLKGKYTGRKPSLSAQQIEELKQILEQKNQSVEAYKAMPLSKIAEHFQVSLPTIKRYAAKLQKEQK